MKTIELNGVSPEKKKDEIRSYFEHTYRLYESLFELIVDKQGFYQKADPLRHPLIFYFGHTAVFFINKLKLAKLIDNGADPVIESICAIGVDEMSWDDLDEANYDWPTIESVKEYRQKVFDIVVSLIDRLPLDLPITWDSPWWVILMGIEHENIHIETSSVLIRQLPLEYIAASKKWGVNLQTNSTYPQNSLVQIPATDIILDKETTKSLYYGWDNEYGKHQASIPPFEASKYLVSNGEFLEFVTDGGYTTREYWDDEGWSWRQYHNTTMPRFWRKVQNSYTLRTLCDEVPLPLDWPVEVNYHEASAFCKWLASKTNQHITLPTEDEYYAMVKFATLKEANIDLAHTSSTPVDYYPHGELYDVIGNVWQWTKTPIYPFDGFKVHHIYDDFTVPTFDGKHNLIKGGSWISCGNLADNTSRYAFRKHFYQHAGFRYINSSYNEHVASSEYIKDAIVSQYCHFGWEENLLGVANYPKTCIETIKPYLQDRRTQRAFDVGCAIGRSSFELATIFDEVVGVDFSARFIQHAIALKETSTIRYFLTTEGELEEFHEVNLSDFGFDRYKDKVTFWQADACNLKPIFRDFDLIFAGNLIDRLYDPKRFLDSLHERLNDGGLVVLTSPYTWLEEFTPKEKWLGGYRKDGEAVYTLEAMKDILSNHFRLLGTHDIAFVIQETARKHQHTISQMSVWEKI
ncbi:MAG TPA: 5-histidylcysteine sulfoxide synthase [Epsilonproteobacteria bacterium]|nr:5-histidylcysteine sulfoxide synthase [Campylobacterota bacterium]